MATDGRIKGSELAAVLERLASRGDTGLLLLEAGDERAQIALRGGRITGAIHSARGRVLQLQQYLFRLGLIDGVKLDVLSGMREEEGLSFEDVMINGGVVDRQRLTEIVAFKIREIAAEMLAWESVQYRFLQDVSLYLASAVAVDLEVGLVLDDATKLYEEWRTIAAAFSWRDVVLRPAGQSHDHALERDQSIVFRLVGTGAQLQTLAAESGLGPYRTYRAVHQLVRAGLLTMD
ncbi:MAG TPA: DUF4388 domain-containing protein [Candidatus Edwardsbacteria bacterium]|nr:DUF4388 domain-containing protein [Candidatus Edwardsbacteria bacterium]